MFGKHKKAIGLILTGCIALSSMGMALGQEPEETAKALDSVQSIQAAYYVSPSGNDNHPGTQELPFATVRKAQEIIRDTKGEMTGDIIVYLRDGSFVLEDSWLLDERDSGNQGYSVIYKAYGNEKPIIEGGKDITGWTLYDADKNIYRAQADNVRTRQIYVNGIRAVRARTEGALANPVKTAQGYLTDDVWLAGLSNPSDVECVFKAAWTNPRVGVQAVSELNGKALVTLNSSLWSSVMNRSKLTQWYLENAFEFIDEAGEWYLDNETSSLYYKPRAGEDMSSARVTVAALENVVRIEGSSLDTPVKNIRFEGIGFSYSTWMKPTDEGGWIDEQNNYKVGTLEMPGAAVNLTRAINVVFERCDFSRLGGTGINLLQGVQDTLIRGCRFYDISGSAVNAGETSKKNAGIYNPGDQRLVLKNNDIVNNYIHDAAVEYRGATAITNAFPMDIDISHNEIYNVPYSGISFFGSVYAPVTTTKNARIENNFIHDLMGDGIFDGGAIYAFGVTGGTAENPNLISGNYIKNQMNRYAVIYMDQSSDYWKIEKNVVDLRQTPIWDDIYDTNWAFTNINTHDIRLDNNYTTTGYFWNKSTGANIVKTNDHIYPDADWPAEALSIIANAGLEPEYKDIARDTIEILQVPDKLNLASGESTVLNVSASDGKGVPIDIASAGIFYMSKNPSVASVDASGNINAIGPGRTDIVLHVFFNGSLTKKVIPVYVDDVLTDVEVYYALENVKHMVPESITFAPGTMRQLVARGITGEGQALDGTDITFTSSNPGVATALYGQLVTHEPGTADITVSTALNGITASRVITIHVIDYSDEASLSYGAISANGAIRDPKKWYVNQTTSTATAQEGILDINTPGSGFATYRGRLYGDELITMHMKINAAGGWPAIVLRNQNYDKSFQDAGNSLYMICFKANLIELHRFNGGERTVFYGEIAGYESLGGASCPNTAIPFNETHLVQAGAVNEEDGVRIILNVDGKNVFTYLDTEEDKIAEDGYFGLYARSGSITLSETAMGLPGEDERPPLEMPVAALTGVYRVTTGQNFTLEGTVIPNSRIFLTEAQLHYDPDIMEWQSVSSLLPGVSIASSSPAPGVLALFFEGDDLSVSGSDEAKLFAVTFKALGQSDDSSVILSGMSFDSEVQEDVASQEVVKTLAVANPVPGGIYEGFDTYPAGTIGGTSGYVITPSNLGYFSISETPTITDKSFRLFKETTNDAASSTCTKIYSAAGISGRMSVSYLVMKDASVENPHSFINLRDKSGKVIATVIFDTTLRVRLGADTILVGSGSLLSGMWYQVSLDLDFDAHTVSVKVKEMSGEQRVWTMTAQPMQNLQAANFSRIEYVLWSTRTGAFYYNSLAVEPE